MPVRDDQLQLIHQAHVHAIIDAPFLKDDNGRELRRLHDIANQHTRAMKTMDYSPWTFVTSILVTELDQTTMFEWQKHSQGLKDVPEYTELLEFLDLGAQTTKNTKEESVQKHSSSLSSKKTAFRPSYAVLTKRTWRVRRPIIHSTPVKRPKHSRTNKRWVWSRITNYV